MSGSVWETALELASLYGWKPAGTETPHPPGDGHAVRAPAGPAWNRLDYFSHESQRVGNRDARAFAESVLRALARIPDRDIDAKETAQLASNVLPSRHSAIAEGMTAPRRGHLRRLAAFADSGGFRIAGAG